MADSVATPTDDSPRGRLTGALWLGLIAAFLGWMFDGMEMGLYSLVIKPALYDLLHTTKDADIGPYMSATVAMFLTGMAAGGLLFGRLGDRIGRVKSMAISILVYATFTAASGFTTHWSQLAACRFLGAMGLGGEWGLGVALVMESWPNASRPLLAGLLGAAANFGFLASSGIGWLARAYDWGWREPLWCGAIPAALLFLLRLGVKEPERYVRSRAAGETSRVAELFGPRYRRNTLIGSGLGAIAVLGMWGAYQTWLPAWAQSLVVPDEAKTSVAQATTLVAALPREPRPPQTEAEWRQVDEAVRASLAAAEAAQAAAQRTGAEAAGVALAAREAQGALNRARRGSGSEASAAVTVVQPLPQLAQKALDGAASTARAATMMWVAIGSIIGAMLGGLIGGWLGRRRSYILLCLGSVAMAALLYLTVHEYGPIFLLYAALAGVPITAFFGWLPLYLPELYPTRLRATGEGFCFNVGRILSAVGVFGTGMLVAAFGSFPYASVTMSAIFLLGIPLALLAPETKGQDLPE